MRGRPPKNAADLHDSRIELRLTATTINDLKIQAARAGVPVAIYARMLLVQGLQGGTKDEQAT